MKGSHVTAFLAGIMVGAFLISVPMRRQVEYWKGSYCVDTTHDLEFCEEFKLHES